MLTHHRRLSGCGRASTGQGVALVRSGDGVARFTGVQTCGSVWACAVCSAKIRQGRAEELEAGVRAHMDRGGGAFFVTLTVRHRLGDSLSDLLGTVAGSYRSLSQGRNRVVVPRGADASANEVVGVVRALEVTHGANGWHPHLHVLVLTGSRWSESAVTEFGDDLFGRWSDAVARRLGEDHRPGRVGFMCRPVTDEGTELAWYLCKVEGVGSLGLEMTRGDLKAGRNRSRTPFELAETAAAHLVSSGELVSEFDLWQEYEAVTRGRQALTWTRGLRAYLAGITSAVDAEERSDDELAAEAPEDEDDQVVRVFTVEQWSGILAGGLRTDLLDAAESGDEAVALLLARHRLE
jgi:hypothetical protein